MNTNQSFEILSVKPAPANASYLGTVAFAFQPSKFHPFRVIHSVEQKDGWQNYVDAEIEGASVIRVRSSFLRISSKGQLYVQAPNLDIPWDIATQVAEAASDSIAKQNGGEA